MLHLPQDPNLHARNGRTALISASYAGHLGIVSLLLEADADKDSSDHLDRTALMQASVSGHVAIVRLLLHAGTSKDVADNYGCTALILSASAGHLEIVSLLLEADADNDLADHHGRTALWMASDAGHVEILRVLLERGAHRNAMDEYRCTALWKASSAGHVEIVRLLLAADASQDVADKYGVTPLWTASFAGHVDIVRLLLHLLLEARANQEAADVYRGTALWAASSVGHADIIRLLLKAGASKDVADKHGVTALARASDVGHVEIVCLLREVGAKKEVADNDGCTTLMRACDKGVADPYSDAFGGLSTAAAAERSGGADPLAACIGERDALSAPRGGGKRGFLSDCRHLESLLKCKNTVCYPLSWQRDRPKGLSLYEAMDASEVVNDRATAIAGVEVFGDSFMMDASAHSSGAELVDITLARYEFLKAERAGFLREPAAKGQSWFQGVISLPEMGLQVHGAMATNKSEAQQQAAVKMLQRLQEEAESAGAVWQHPLCKSAMAPAVRGSLG
eukprot:s2272_g4.t1